MLESQTAPQNLSIERLTYRFRFCERCRREWANEETQCRTCARWLGDAPLERFEWQISPITRAHFRPITDGARRIAPRKRLMAPDRRSIMLDVVVKVMHRARREQSQNDGHIRQGQCPYQAVEFAVERPVGLVAPDFSNSAGDIVGAATQLESTLVAPSLYPRRRLRCLFTPDLIGIVQPDRVPE